MVVRIVGGLRGVGGMRLFVSGLMVKELTNKAATDKVVSKYFSILRLSRH
jgi:hypothetical protein